MPTENELQRLMEATAHLDPPAPLKGYIPPRPEMAEYWIAKWNEGADEIMERLIAELVAIDRKHGIEPRDYSSLRRKTVPVHLQNPAYAAPLEGV